MTISTRTILIAAVIFNVIAIGLSEVQRRELGRQSVEATLELRRIEQQRLEQQTVELDRTYKLIAEINNRVNNVEIQMQSGPMQAQVYDVDKRVQAIQMKIEALNAGK
ncbi:hypothetical protein ABIB82_007581 [Bradyrhizobium sp. i1.8.4]|uniref:hypothetical protein n=1 Tax=unclassified Bradyrhizobium TaxID=2631580 RepID=UPI003D1CD6FE